MIVRPATRLLAALVPALLLPASGASRLAITPIGDGSVNLAGYADDAFRGGLSMNSRGRSPKVHRG